jgi:hypothetical protein
MVMKFLKENDIISFDKKNLQFEYEVKLLYETGETIVLLTLSDLDSAKKTLKETIFLIKISSYFEETEEDKKVKRRLSQIEYLFTKKSRQVFCQCVKIYEKVHDTSKDNQHLAPKYKNKFIIFDKENFILFTSTEVIFVNSYLKK